MMSVMDIAYMNDPNEGMMLRKFLYANNIPQKPGRKEATLPFVFIKCFTSRIDYLPMWQMYGAAAKGVCLVIDWSNISGIDLFRVCYFSHTTNGYNLKGDDNKGIKTKEIMHVLRQLRSLFSQLKNKDEKEVFESIIEPILFLFKDNSYSYEQEYRIMYSYDYHNKRMRHTSETPPKLFVLPPCPIQIKEIVLGPKFENANGLMPYLREQLELMAEKTSTHVPRITFSNIDFR